MLLRRRRHLGEFRLAQQSARPQLRPLCSERVQTRSQLPGSLLARAWYWRNAAHLLNLLKPIARIRQAIIIHFDGRREGSEVVRGGIPKIKL